MPLPTISALPTPPATTDDSVTFNTRAFAIFDALHDNLVPQINAWAAALPANITGTDFSATSTTSLTIGTGSKALTIQTGKQFQIGQPVRIAYTTTPSNFMDGQVTAYNSGTGALVVDVQSVGGAGTQALWTISILPGGAGSFATLAGVETLINKSFTTPTLTGTASGTVAGRLGFSGGAFSYGDGTNQRIVANLNEAQTFTNKTIALGSNSVSGTIAQFNAACSDADFATIAGIETFVNKTLTAPTINGGTIDGATLTPDCVISDVGGPIGADSPGFRGLPSATLAGGAGRTAGAQIALILADASKRIINTAGGWLIPANASVAFPIGTIIGGYNDSGASQTLAITSDTLRLDGTASTGARTVAQYGRWIAEKVKAAEWVVSGSLS
jgi:hypothetical protein